MAGPLYYDRVKDTSSSYNSTAFTLAGATPSGGTIANFSVVGNGNTCYYVAYDSSGNCEIQGPSAYTSSGTTLARGTPLSSTNGGSQVTFSGTVTLELVAPAKLFTNALRSDVADQTISGGANVTTYQYTPSGGAITIDCGLRPMAYVSRTAALTINAPSADGSQLLDIENGSGAGTVTWSGFYKAPDGDTLDTVNGNYFRVFITRNRGRSIASIKALQ